MLLPLNDVKRNSTSVNYNYNILSFGMFNMKNRTSTVHTWLLDPLLEQQHIRLQLYVRNFNLLWYASRMNYNIIKVLLTGHCIIQILKLVKTSLLEIYVMDYI